MAGESIQVGAGKGELVPAAGFDKLLAKVRPEWQARDLIGRVRALLPVDRSSACQRLLNAAIHDLRQKILITGAAGSVEGCFGRVVGYSSAIRYCQNGL
jgi:hypothetical protein